MILAESKLVPCRLDNSEQMTRGLRGQFLQNLLGIKEEDIRELLLYSANDIRCLGSARIEGSKALIKFVVASDIFGQPRRKTFDVDVYSLLIQSDPLCSDRNLGCELDDLFFEFKARSTASISKPLENPDSLLEEFSAAFSNRDCVHHRGDAYGRQEVLQERACARGYRMQEQ
jgi:hypothetical protein